MILGIIGIVVGLGVVILAVYSFRHFNNHAKKMQKLEDAITADFMPSGLYRLWRESVRGGKTSSVTVAVVGLTLIGLGIVRIVT